MPDLPIPEWWYHDSHGLHDTAHHQHHNPLHLCVPLYDRTQMQSAINDVSELIDALRSHTVIHETIPWREARALGETCKYCLLLMKHDDRESDGPVD